MNLRKMLLLASMALALVALAAPAAQAHDHGLFEGGTRLANGAGVTITSTDLETHTGLGSMTCEKVTLHYTVESNTNTHLALTPIPKETENATAVNCHLNGTTVHVTLAGTDTVTFDTWGNATVQSRFTAKITSFIPLHCTYTGAVTIKGFDLTDEIAIGPSTLTSGCGNGEITGTGTVETSNGVAVTAQLEET